ncbi:hypothetical protein D1872_269520 [compost metagenome]
MVGKPAATVITSSPGMMRFSFNLGEVKAEIANKLAEDPEFVNKAYLTPKYSANSFSNCLWYLPAVSQKSNEESTRLLISSAL